MTAEPLPRRVERVLGLVRRPAGPGPFVLAVDGRSGSGKSELAAAVVGALRARGAAVRLLALEDAYPGWSGLAAGVRAVAEGVLAPLARGEPGAYRRYDWVAGRPAGTVTVAPDADVLVVEGCGAGAAACAPFVDALVWLEAPEPVRRDRALRRDAGSWAHLWDHWAAQEAALLAERDARALADLVLSTG